MRSTDNLHVQQSCFLIYIFNVVHFIIQVTFGIDIAYIIYLSIHYSKLCKLIKIIYDRGSTGLSLPSKCRIYAFDNIYVRVYIRYSHWKLALVHTSITYIINNKYNNIYYNLYFYYFKRLVAHLCRVSQGSYATVLFRSSSISRRSDHRLSRRNSSGYHGI